jgi:hypothetical protein
MEKSRALGSGRSDLRSGTNALVSRNGDRDDTKTIGRHPRRE